MSYTTVEWITSWQEHCHLLVDVKNIMFKLSMTVGRICYFISQCKWGWCWTPGTRRLPRTAASTIECLRRWISVSVRLWWNRLLCTSSCRSDQRRSLNTASPRGLTSPHSWVLLNPREFNPLKRTKESARDTRSPSMFLHDGSFQGARFTRISRWLPPPWAHILTRRWASISILILEWWWLARWSTTYCQ